MRSMKPRGCHLSGTTGEDKHGPYELVCICGRKGCVAHAKVDPGWPWQNQAWHLCMGYASCAPDRQTRYVMHRVVVGARGKHVHVDHVNGDRLDNRLKNLRVVRPCENSYNRVSHGSSSRFKGVSANGQVTAKGDGWRISVGGFRSEEEAARAYDEIVRKYHSSTATYNYPRSGERSAVTGEIEP